MGPFPCMVCYSTGLVGEGLNLLGLLPSQAAFLVCCWQQIPTLPGTGLGSLSYLGDMSCEAVSQYSGKRRCCPGNLRAQGKAGSLCFAWAGLVLLLRT